MTAGEFRLLVDARYRAVRRVDGRIRKFAEAHGYGYRAVRSWYYSERPIPSYVDLAIRPGGSPKNVQLNAALRLIGAEIDRLEEHVAAVRRMCLDCEPDGLCHQSECPLRAVSPLRLAGRAAA